MARNQGSERPDSDRPRQSSRNPIGNSYLYGFHDITSRGFFGEATYISEIGFGRFTLYPMLGAEYRSTGYVRHLYGLSADEALQNGLASYRPGASFSPNAGFALDVPVVKNILLTVHWHRRWFDSAVSSSPLTDRKTQDNGFVALAYRFQ